MILIAVNESWDSFSDRRFGSTKCGKFLNLSVIEMSKVFSAIAGWNLIYPVVVFLSYLFCSCPKTEWDGVVNYLRPDLPYKAASY